MSEQRIKIGSRVLIGAYRRGLVEAKVLRLANHPRYDALSVEVEYSTIFGSRVKWLNIDEIKGILPEDGAATPSAQGGGGAISGTTSPAKRGDAS